MKSLYLLCRKLGQWTKCHHDLEVKITYKVNVTLGHKLGQLDIKGRRDFLAIK